MPDPEQLAIAGSVSVSGTPIGDEGSFRNSAASLTCPKVQEGMEETTTDPGVDEWNSSVQVAFAGEVPRGRVERN